MARVAPIFKHERTTFERLEKFVSKEYFTDCNLRGRLYGQEKNVNKILHIDCGQDRISFDEAKNRLTNGVEVHTGITIGPTWSTHWFKLSFDAPRTWADNKNVHLIWNTGSEAMVWSTDGYPLQGLSGDCDRTDFCVKDNNVEEIYVEVACNSMFGAGNNGFINAPDPNKTFTLKTAKLAVFREEIYQLLMDFDVLIGICKQVPQENPKRYETLHFANSLVNEFVDEPPVLQRMHDDATNFLLQHKQIVQNFEIHAVGNCHIDTAWLWTYDETKRKCARSWATSLALMDQFPNLLRFACSQAQQLEWVKEKYPSLFQKILRQAKQKRFIPVGGCWVEMDGNLPGGESFVRQILYGQKFFLENFGVQCTEFWLPDTFGYSAQLPQLLALGGMNRFVTQKLSWNLINKFPHHTFWWRGIDGTRVLSHFPPGDTYGMQVTVEDTMKTVNNFRDKGRSNAALMLYGHGDGGGGPDREMLERLTRLKNAPGCPSVIPSTPAEFFEHVERSDLSNLCTWDGELYLELHNGTYTTHGALKQMNRRCEFLLRDCEFLSVINYLSSQGKICRSFEKEWKKVLLNQFHDVLPGTSIGQVIKEAREIHIGVVNECEKYLAEGKISSSSEPIYLNSMQWSRLGDDCGNKNYYVKPFSVSNLSVDDVGDEQASVSVSQDGSNFILENYSLRAVFNEIGQLISLRSKRLKKENEIVEENFSVASGERADRNADRHLDLVPDDRYGNTFVIFDDIPLFWDAWDVMDYHLETRKELKKSKITAKIHDNYATKVSIIFEMEISANSYLSQHIVLRPFRSYLEFHTTVNWHESHKMLKVEFPINVRTTKVTCEIQFGHVERPTHRNTSWDSAKFEVCAQKWADLSEYDAGVALINGGKYGYSCYDNILSLSLLRSPKAPDADADMETHRFSYAVMPHLGPLQNGSGGRWGRNVIQNAYDFNSNLRQVYPLNNSIVNETIFTLDSPNVIIESVKISECQNGVIVRMYESFSTKCVSTFWSRFKIKEAHICNLLETSTERISTIDESDERVRLFFKPFQIVSLLLIFNFSD